MEEAQRQTGRTSERFSDAFLLAALWAALLLFLLGLFVVRGFDLPVGPDAPVYLWWARLAGHDGLSAAARPGVPALALVLQGLGLRLTAALAALECVLGASVGLAAAALVRGRSGSRAGWVLAGVLTGTFAVHLATGYLANLAFAVLFLGAAVALSRATRRATVAAAGLLGAAGLAHPLFFLLGLLILALSAALAWRVDRDEAVRVLAATVGGGALLGVGILALQAGPGPLAVDTSRDGFVRRAGLTDVLRSAYVDRFVHRWTRYVQWASIPLAITGLKDATGFAGRFLRAWGITLVAGVAFSLATGLFPADRFITFGYVVPILAALGLVRLRHALESRRALAILATGALTVAMLAGAWIAWARQAPFLSNLEVARVRTAATYAAGTAPGTLLEFLVNDDDATLTFLATRAGNVIRAGMPPDRIRDVVVKVPWPVSDGSPERWHLSNLTAQDARAAAAAGNGRSVTFVVGPFDRIDLPSSAAPGLVSEGIFVSSPVLRPRPVADPLEPSSPGGIAVATIVTLALLSAAGYGWARAATADGFLAAALAPAFGTGALILVAIALERLGVPLTGFIGPLAVSALAGGGGYVARFALERRAAANAA